MYRIGIEKKKLTVGSGSRRAGDGDQSGGMAEEERRRSIAQVPDLGGGGGGHGRSRAR
jgi:hypothetical protein